MVENGKKHRQSSHLIIHFPTSEGVNEVSERVNDWAKRRARAKRTVRSKQTSERCERTSERTSEWPSTTVCILGWSRPQRTIETGEASFLCTTQLRLRKRRKNVMRRDTQKNEPHLAGRPRRHWERKKRSKKCEARVRVCVRKKKREKERKKKKKRNE